MTTATTPASPGFHFEDTVPAARAVSQWNDISPSIRQGSGPADVREAKLRGDVLAAATSALSVQYLELLSAQDALTERLDAASDELERVNTYLALPDDEDDGGVIDLAHYVRWYHDRNHATHSAWAVCAHEMCRQAGRWVK